MRFLIIEDDLEYVRILRYHIEVEWPDAVVEVFRPVRAQALPASFGLERYDAVLLGHPAGGVTGLLWLERLRQQAACPPVVLFATGGDELLAVDALKAGAASYFPKSAVTHHRLVGTLRREIGSVELGEPPILSGWAADYRVTRTLHATDIATVYLAESSGGDASKLALKVIRSVPDAGGERLFDRFLQEYELIAVLDHPNVVRIHDLGIADDHAYIAMEYLAAGTLGERMRGALRPELAYAYVNQIGRALEAIHGTGILHRDLKPANVMFREDETLALIDFGLAKRMRLDAALTGEGQIFGTPYYMSPEQGHAEPTDERSDIYSLGCIFYEMLTGRRPFVGGTAMGVIYKHAKSARPRLAASLEAFQAPLDRMMAVRPEDRYESAAAMLDDLAAIAH